MTQHGLLFATLRILTQFSEADFEQSSCAVALGELFDDYNALDYLHAGNWRFLMPHQRVALYDALTAIKDLDRALGGESDENRILNDARWPRVRILAGRALEAIGFSPPVEFHYRAISHSHAFHHAAIEGEVE